MFCLFFRLCFFVLLNPSSFSFLIASSLYLSFPLFSLYFARYFLSIYFRPISFSSFVLYFLAHFLSVPYFHFFNSLCPFVSFQPFFLPSSLPFFYNSFLISFHFLPFPCLQCFISFIPFVPFPSSFLPSIFFPFLL